MYLGFLGLLNPRKSVDFLFLLNQRENSVILSSTDPV